LNRPNHPKTIVTKTKNNKPEGCKGVCPFLYENIIVSNMREAKPSIMNILRMGIIDETINSAVEFSHRAPRNRAKTLFGASHKPKKRTKIDNAFSWFVIQVPRPV
jgi:hypothetical protein